ncbi:TetR/AcrR family transcriptional regulator [Nocardioides pacificus]
MESAETESHQPTDASQARPKPRRTRQDARRDRTQKALVAAARVVFERDGFYNARLSDITAEAKVASGTLYNYYRSKHEIFRDVMAEVVAEMTAIPPDHVSSQQDPVARLQEVNKVYVRAHRRNARMMSLMYQAGDGDEHIREQSEELIAFFQDRATAAIESWQRAGLCDQDLDPRHTAHALTFMVERLVLAWATGPVEYDEETLLATVDRIWLNGTGLRRVPE